MRPVIFPMSALAKVLGKEEEEQMFDLARGTAVGFSDIKGYSGEFFLKDIPPKKEDNGVFNPFTEFEPLYHLVMVGIPDTFIKQRHKYMSVYIFRKHKDGMIKAVVSGEKIMAREADVSDIFMVQWAKKAIQALSLVNFEKETVMNPYRFVWRKYPKFRDLFKVV